MRKLKYVQDRNVSDYKFKKRCKECSCVTVSNKPLMNGDPCEPCVISNGVTKDSVLTDYFKPFPDSI